MLPNAWFEELNKGIVDREGVKVPERITPFLATSPLRICVTNFGRAHMRCTRACSGAYKRIGFGGSNAAALLEDFQSQALSHDVAGQLRIEENDSSQCSGEESSTNGQYVSTDAQADEFPPRLFVLSARCEASLTASVAIFGEYLQGCAQKPDLARDISYTLCQRRSHFSDRLATSASSLQSLQERVADPGLCRRGRVRSHTIAFVFTGQGAQ